MYGAIIGDIVGSKYEFNNIKTKDFEFISEGCDFTDDTVMTVAVANAIMRAANEETNYRKVLVEEMQRLGRKHTGRGYGGNFAEWLQSDKPEPYNSFGNGSAMRVSPCALAAISLQEAVNLATATSEVTHNHPEGVKGARATATAIFLARCDWTMEQIQQAVEENFYKLDKTIDEIRPRYRFNETCQETVPQAMVAFYESSDYEDAIRNAISIGGDSDTVAAITGSVAWTYYGTKEDRKPISDANFAKAQSLLPEEFIEIINKFEKFCDSRVHCYDKMGFCPGILTHK